MNISYVFFSQSVEPFLYRPSQQTFFRLILALALTLALALALALTLAERKNLSQGIRLTMEMICYNCSSLLAIIMNNLTNDVGLSTEKLIFLKVV